MNSTLKRWQNDRTIAHVAPLMWFIVMMMILGFVGESVEWKHPSAPWWRHWPDTWALAFNVVTTGGILVFFWKHYEFRWSASAVVIGAIMGAVGIAFWLLPTSLHGWWGLESNPESGWMSWLGINDRAKGLDPAEFGNVAAYWSWLTIRFFKAVVIVALVEEIFWRSFLMRFLLNMDGKYWKVPFGKASWLTYVVVTFAFMLAHNPIDYAAAIVYGSLTYLVAVQTKSLLACVVMHGVANFLMCWYAVETGKFGLL